MKFYRGAARAARAYVELDRSRADDYYLGEGSGVAVRLTATGEAVERAGEMSGEVYEQWVAGLDVDTGKPKGRLRTDGAGLRFVEVVVNGPKTWSLAAALHPDVSEALDAAQDRAAHQIVSWVAQHATTRVGPRGRQVQVPVERLEAAVIRHYTSRAGDPHRHLHLQINARVYAAGGWRGLHSVGVRDSIEAINGIGHAAVATDPRFRSVLAGHGLTLDPGSGEVVELARYVGAFSARAAQIHRNLDRYEAAWRSANPGQEPGPRLLEAWDRRAWAQARPDKVVPRNGAELVDGWRADLQALGYRDPPHAAPLDPVAVGRVDRDAAADWVLSELGGRRSAWNGADVRGSVELLLAEINVVTPAAVREELAEDITARASERCTPLLTRTDVPEHVRSLTSPQVLQVEREILLRLDRRASRPARPARLPPVYRTFNGGNIDTGTQDKTLNRAFERMDASQAQVAVALAGDSALLVVEGAAGAGKTTTLAAAQQLLARQGRRMLVVTPTLKAAEVAARETGAPGRSTHWLAQQHAWRQDQHQHWTWDPDQFSTTGIPEPPDPTARLRSGDLLLIDEAGMLDQNTARVLLAIADQCGARVALMGDRHQLPAIGPGGVLDHAVAWAHPTAVFDLDQVHRFTDPRYAALSLQMRTGHDPGAVFDVLHRDGRIVVHASEAERNLALSDAGSAGDLVVADTREQVARLNGAIRNDIQDHRRSDQNDRPTLTTTAGERIGLGDRVATRLNDHALGVANRQTWTVTAISDDGSLILRDSGRRSSGGGGRDRAVPAGYAARHVELAYATTVHGAQGETVDRCHVLVGESTGAAAAYVAMTRGREQNTAHLVADSVPDARDQWVDVFGRDRADLGPSRARERAIEDIDRYGPEAPRRRTRSPSPAENPYPSSYPDPSRAATASDPGISI